MKNEKTPLDGEEFMESVYKKELGPDFTTVESGVAIGEIDWTKDSEYIRLFGDNRPPPLPPMSPFEHLKKFKNQLKKELFPKGILPK